MRIKTGECQYARPVWDLLRVCFMLKTPRMKAGRLDVCASRQASDSMHALCGCLKLVWSQSNSSPCGCPLYLLLHAYCSLEFLPLSQGWAPGAQFFL